MKGLLIKDFNLLKKRGIFLFVFIVGYTVYQLGTFNMEWAVGFGTLMITMFSLTTITYDEYENGMPFLLTLPIRRVDYVREKYVFGFLITTVMWMLLVAACFLFDIMIWRKDGGDFGVKLVICVAYLVFVYFLISLQIPLKLKFAERSGIVTTIVVVIIGVFCSIVFIEFEYGVSFLELGLDWNVVAAGAIVVLLALMFVSYRWAVRIMEKREF